MSIEKVDTKHFRMLHLFELLKNGLFGGLDLCFLLCLGEKVGINLGRFVSSIPVRTHH